MCLRLHSRSSDADRAAEVLRGDDRRGVDRPEVGELHAALLEDGLAGLPVGLHDVAALPGQLVVRVHALGAEHALDRQSRAGPGLGLGAGGPVAHRLGHPSVSRLSRLLCFDPCCCHRHDRWREVGAPGARCFPTTHAGRSGSARRHGLVRRRSLRPKGGDLVLEVVGGLEGAVHASEAQVGDLVEAAQRAEDRQAHLVGRDLGGARAAAARPRPPGPGRPGRPR